MKIGLKNLPEDVLAHFGDKFKSFNRICKAHFKSKCPHALGLNQNSCKNCIEKRAVINFAKKYIPSTKFHRFSIFYYAHVFSIHELTLKKHINNTITSIVLKLGGISEPV